MAGSCRKPMTRRHAFHFRGLFRPRVLPLWLALLGYFIFLARNFSRLPRSVAIHFDALGAANGWASRGLFAVSSIFLLAAVVLIFSACLPPAKASRRAVAAGFHAFAYALTALVSASFVGVLGFNVGGAASFIPMDWAALGGAVLGALVGLTLPSRPRHPHPFCSAPPLGQAENTSLLQACIIWVAEVFILVLTANVLRLQRHLAGIAVLFVVLAAALLYIAVITTQGFRFIVFPDRVRVQWGFQPLRVIPARDIQDVEVAPINPLVQFGGWGARANGRDHAYILKGRWAVRVATAQGDIYLGANDPQNLLHLLRPLLAADSSAGA